MSHMVKATMLQLKDVGLLKVFCIVCCPTCFRTGTIAVFTLCATLPQEKWEKQNNWIQQI